MDDTHSTNSFLHKAHLSRTQVYFKTNETGVPEKLVAATPEGARAGWGSSGESINPPSHQLRASGSAVSSQPRGSGLIPGRQMFVLHFKSSSWPLLAKMRSCFCDCWLSRTPFWAAMTLENWGEVRKLRGRLVRGCWGVEIFLHVPAL